MSNGIAWDALNRSKQIKQFYWISHRCVACIGEFANDISFVLLYKIALRSQLFIHSQFHIIAIIIVYSQRIKNKLSTQFAL